tara:strand:+ start:42 stop:695 length:654 start_codon:yes stop_codon:yes gene_type:complete
MAFKMKGFSGFGNSPAKQTIKIGSHGDIHKTDKVKQKNSELQDTKENREIMKRLVKERNEPRKITYPEVPKGQEEFREVKYVKVESPTKQKKIKNKGHMEGPIPEQNIKLQPGENDGTWIYGRGYEGEDPKEGLAEMKADEKRLNENKNIRPNSGTDFVRAERMIDYDQRAGYLEQNDIPDLEGDNSKKANKKRKQLKKTIKTLDRERQIMKDRTSE